MARDIVNENATINVASRLRGYSFTKEEAHSSRDNGKLLCLRLDTNYTCNLSCSYCYAGPKIEQKQTVMPLEKAKRIIDQASDLGAQSIVYLGGGEPLLYPAFWDLVLYITQKRLIPVVFTNGTLVTESVAKRLFDIGASVITKLDSLGETQNILSGPGSGEKILRGFHTLLEAGFATNSDGVTRLGASILACKADLEEIPRIWEFLRRNNVFPDIERITIVGRARREMELAPQQAVSLIASIRKMDESKFGIIWRSPFSSIPAHSCFICISGCHVTANGGISICPEMPVVRSLDRDTLSEALHSYPFRELRHIEREIEEPCHSCINLPYCLGGCRSKAYCSTGSFFAPDPYCDIVAAAHLAGRVEQGKEGATQ